MSFKSYPKIFSFKEKHGDRIILVNSKVGEDTAFFKILSERYKCGYYDWFNKYKPYKPTPKPEYTLEQINSLPDFVDKDILLNAIKKYERDQKEIKIYQNLFDSIKKCIDENLVESAKSLIINLSDNEYESFDQVNFESFL